MENNLSAPNQSFNAKACVGCQKSLHPSAEICPQCGASQRKRGYKSKAVAAILALFLGGFGIHRFYLGKWWGVFYLLFCWTGIPQLIAFIETLIFIFSAQEKWDIKHNEGIPNKQGSSVLLSILVAVIAVFVFFASIGVLAAIALPAYMDYTTRAKVNAALHSASDIKMSVENYAHAHKQLPNSLSELTLLSPPSYAYIDSIHLSAQGRIEISVDLPMKSTGQNTIWLTPTFENDQLTWTCSGGSLANKYRPAKCRAE